MVLKIINSGLQFVQHAMLLQNNNISYLISNIYFTNDVIEIMTKITYILMCYLHMN